MKREYPGYTIRALAERLGLHQSYLSKLERGEYAPLSQERIMALARELGENEDLLMVLGRKVSDDLAKSIARNHGKFHAFLENQQASPDTEFGKASSLKSELRRRELKEVAHRLCQEVKDRVILEKNLRQKAHEKDVILSNLDSIFIEYIDKDYNLLWGTPNLQQYISTPLHKAFGSKCHTLLCNRDEPCAICSVSRILTTKKVEDNELFFIKDKTLLIRSVPVLDSKGDIFGILRFGFDVTVLHRKIEEISDYEQRLRYALDGAQEEIWEWNIKEKAITYSHYLKRVLGFDDNVLSEPIDVWIARIHPDDRNETWRMVQEHLQSETDYLACFFRMRRKDGDYTWILARGMVTERDHDGNPLVAMGTHSEAEAIGGRPQELTEGAKPVERRLLENCPNKQLILQKIVSQELGIGYMLFDCAQDILVEINGSALEILELPTVTEAMDHRCQQEIRCSRATDNIPTNLFQAKRPALTRYEECVLTLRSGKVAAIGLYTLPVDLYGTPHVVKVLIDINRRRRLEPHKGIPGHFEQIGAVAASISQEIQRIIRRSEQCLLETCEIPDYASSSPVDARSTNLADAAQMTPCKLTPSQRFAIETALSGLRESSGMLKNFLGVSCFPDTNRGVLEINDTLRILLNIIIKSTNPGIEPTLRLSNEIPSLECSPEALNCALFCLLTNAVRHCASGCDTSRHDLACDILQRERGGSVFVKSGSESKLAYLVVLPLRESCHRLEHQGNHDSK